LPLKGNKSATTSSLVVKNVTERFVFHESFNLFFFHDFKIFGKIKEYIRPEGMENYLLFFSLE
jgi:hypothetical protein